MLLVLLVGRLMHKKYEFTQLPNLLKLKYISEISNIPHYESSKKNIVLEKSAIYMVEAKGQNWNLQEPPNPNTTAR